MRHRSSPPSASPNAFVSVVKGFVSLRDLLKVSETGSLILTTNVFCPEGR
jgi:hypothetical protein